MDSSHCIMGFFNGNELTLGEDLSVIFEFVERVGDLRGVYQLANLDDGLLVRGGDQTNFIVGWKHRRPPISVREKHSWFVYAHFICTLAGILSVSVAVTARRVVVQE